MRQHDPGVLENNAPCLVELYNARVLQLYSVAVDVMVSD